MNDAGTKPGCDCGCMGAGPMFTQFLKSLGPSSAVSQHFKNAHLEVMKGLRTYLDEQIKAHGDAGASPSHGTRITVE